MVWYCYLRPETLRTMVSVCHATPYFPVLAVMVSDGCSFPGSPLQTVKAVFRVCRALRWVDRGWTEQNRAEAEEWMAACGIRACIHIQ